MIEIQKEVTVMYELNDKEIGAHLKKLINEKGYKTTAMKQIQNYARHANFLTTANVYSHTNIDV